MAIFPRVKMWIFFPYNPWSFMNKPMLNDTCYLYGPIRILQQNFCASSSLMNIYFIKFINYWSYYCLPLVVRLTPSMRFSIQIAQDVAVQKSLIILSEFKRFYAQQGSSNTGMVACFVSDIFLFFVWKISTALFDRCFIDNRVQGGLIVQSSVTVLASTDCSHIKLWSSHVLNQSESGE